MRASLLALAVLALAGCEDAERSFAGFDGPTDVAFLAPGTFYEVPVVDSGPIHSGIRILGVPSDLIVWYLALVLIEEPPIVNNSGFVQDHVGI